MKKLSDGTSSDNLGGAVHTKGMSERNRNWDIFKCYQWIRLIGITLAVYVTMEYVLPVVFPFCIGFAAAALLFPLRRWLERRLRIRRELAVFAALFLGICTVALLLCGLVYALLCCGSYAGKCGLPELVISQGRLMWNTCCDSLHELTGRWVMQPEDYTVLTSSLEERGFRVDVGSLMDNWKNISGQTLQAVAYVLVAVVSALLMLGDFERLKKRAGHFSRKLFHAGFGLTLKQVGWTYFRAQLIIIGTVTALCVLGLLAAGEHYFLLIGVLIGVCDALPFLGTGICFLPWALWRFLSGRYVTAVWFVALYFITSFTRQTLEPRLIGKKIGVPPLAVLISIYIGVKVFSRFGFLLGPVSAFLIWQLYSDEAAKEDAYENRKCSDRADDKV